MADTFGNPQGATSLPSGAGPEYERSIARSVEHPKDASPDLREKLGEDVAAIKQTAEDVAHKATERAADMAEKQKGYASDQIGKFATALERVGRELQAEKIGGIGDYTKELGDSARRFAENMKDKNLGQIAGYAEDFGRRQPLAFLGMAVLAGLAASRFMIASTDRSANTLPAVPQASGDGTESIKPREAYNG
jgi:hypothetical protein